MKENRTLFQIIVVVFFGLMLISGLIIFATYKPKSEKEKIVIGNVVIWGTMDYNVVDKLLKYIKEKDGRFSNVTYVEKSKSTYTQDILEALAEQEGPDLILLSNDIFLKNRKKIFVIGQNNINKRDYYNTFIDAFSIYTNKDGVLGIPFIIDPMVMYFNKNLFAENRVVFPPKVWEDFEDPNGIISKIRLTDDNSNIIKTAIAMGESVNVLNYKEILYTLFLQNHNPIIIEKNGVYESARERFANSIDVIKFYTQFSDQSNKITYSWNRSKNNSLQEFLSENLGIYLGFASELKKIRLKNPNLNFDVSEMPYFKNSGKRSVYSRTWVFSIPKASKNKLGALQVALRFASKDVQKYLSDKIFLPPVRKDLLNIRPEDLFMDIFYKEAIYASSILDPDYKKTNAIFGEYISNVNSGLKLPGQATLDLSGEIDFLLKKYKF